MSIRTDESVLLRDVAGTTRARMYITFVPPTNPDIIFYQYQIKVAGASTWSEMRTAPVNDASLSITEVQEGVSYSVRVRHVNKTFQVSDWLQLPDTVIIGKQSKPPDVPTLVIENEQVTWRYDSGVGVTVPLDFAGFRVKFAWGNNRQWDQMYVLSDLQVGTSYNIALLPSGPITVAVKAVDMAGNESENAAVLYKDFGASLTENIVLTIAKDPTFPDMITNGTIMAGELVANDNGSIFWNPDPNALFWGSPSALFWVTTYLEMEYYFTYTPPFSISKPFKINLDYLIEGEQYTVEYRTAPGGLFWNANPNALFWNGDPNAIFWNGGVSQWLPFPQGGIDGAYQQYEFRIRTSASVQTRGKIRRLRLLIDMPDLEEIIPTFNVPLAGGRLPITQDFRAISNVTWSVFQDVSFPTAFTVKVVDLDPDLGPLVRVYDDKAVAVAGRISAVVRGY